MNGHEIEANYLRDVVKALETKIAVLELELDNAHHLVQEKEEEYKGVF